MRGGLIGGVDLSGGVGEVGGGGERIGRNGVYGVGGMGWQRGIELAGSERDFCGKANLVEWL